MRTKPCSTCGPDGFSKFNDKSKAPVHVGVIWASEEEAKHCHRSDATVANRSRRWRKTVAFIIMLQTDDQIMYVVDINPGKQVTYWREEVSRS